jgi:hypothetical protein
VFEAVDDAEPARSVPRLRACYGHGRLMRIRHAACACLVSAAMSCASPHGPARVPADVPPALDASVAAYRYRVRATPGAAELEVDVDVPRGAPAAPWRPDPHLSPYLRDVSYASRSQGEFVAVQDTSEGFLVPACAARAKRTR